MPVAPDCAVVVAAARLNLAISLESRQVSTPQASTLEQDEPQRFELALRAYNRERG
jgi:hypothetical protein